PVGAFALGQLDAAIGDDVAGEGERVLAEEDLARRQLEADGAKGEETELLRRKLAEQGDAGEERDVAVETHLRHRRPRARLTARACSRRRRSPAARHWRDRARSSGGAGRCGFRACAW